MGAASAVILEARGVLRASGPDARAFLQGLVTNDLDKLSPERALWAALLTPQGKYLHDFFLVVPPDDPAAVLIECEAERRDDLKRRLGLYRLRSKVTLEDETARWRIAAAFGPGALEAVGLAAERGRAAGFGGGIAYVDPRLAELGARLLLPAERAEGALAEAGLAPGDLAAYEALRLSLGVPDGSRDLEVERSPLLENGFDELGAIDWGKGCFMGQELTARTKYRALTKKRLLPVTIDGPAPAPGTPVLRGETEAGVMRSSADGVGLALLRLEHVKDKGADELTAGAARLRARKPDWAEF